MPGYVVDPPPASLVRAFKESSHRGAFLDGHLRMQLISQFRSTGDVREDATEGLSYVRVPGRVPVVQIDTESFEIIGRHETDGHFHRQSQYLNPTYVLSCSSPSVDVVRLSTEFGAHLIEILDPEELLRRIYRSASQEVIPARDLSFLDAFSVRYTKGDVGLEPSDAHESLRLDYGQKPMSYSWEEEYRVVLSFSGPLHSYPKVLKFDVGDLRDIARPIV